MNKNIPLLAALASTVRRSFLGSALTILALGVGGCAGYTPLYVPVEGETVAMDRVEIHEVAMSRLSEKNVGERRVAQVMDQRLRQDFPNKGADLDQLSVYVKEDSSALALRRSALVEREQLTLTANIQLTDASGAKLFATDIANTTAYNVETTPYSTESGKTFARLTAARNLAEEIGRRLALYYRTRSAE